MCETLINVSIVLRTGSQLDNTCYFFTSHFSPGKFCTIGISWFPIFQPSKYRTWTWFSCKTKTDKTLHNYSTLLRYIELTTYFFCAQYYSFQPQFSAQSSRELLLVWRWSLCNLGKWIFEINFQLMAISKYMTLLNNSKVNEILFNIALLNLTAPWIPKRPVWFLFTFLWYALLVVCSTYQRRRKLVPGTQIWGGHFWYVECLFLFSFQYLQSLGGMGMVPLTILFPAPLLYVLV